MANPVETPRSLVKREHVRSVAQRLFVELGFEGTTMDAIANAASVSKPTLYRYYHNKETLFADVLRGLNVRRVWSDAPTVVIDHPITSRAELARLLTALAQRAVSHLLDPTYLGLLRVLIAEIPRFPQLAPIFRVIVRDEGPHVLSSVLERARAAGLVHAPTSEALARLFIGPLLSYVVIDGLLTAPDQAREPTPTELAALVDLFLEAIGPPGSSGDGRDQREHPNPTPTGGFDG
ncbi:MAG: TetR/AcrR family transcriptional regulator [Chloroflexota bacterium]